MYEGKTVLTCEHRVCSCLVKAEAIETAFGDLVTDYIHGCLEDMLKQILTQKPFNHHIANLCAPISAHILMHWFVKNMSVDDNDDQDNYI
jgi:hypothetical protein